MISPIEFSGIIQRSNDASALQQNENTKAQFDQVNFQQHMNKEINQKSEQVVKQENADKKDKKYDAKEKGSNEYFGNNKNNKKNDSKEKEKEDGQILIKKPSGFDVRI